MANPKYIFVVGGVMSGIGKGVASSAIGRILLSKGYIRAPFIVEGTLYGLIAGIITLLLFYPLTWWLGNATERFFGGINVFNYYVANFPFFFLIIAGSGVVLGAVASYLAVRRYLKI